MHMNTAHCITKQNKEKAIKIVFTLNKVCRKNKMFQKSFVLNI